MLSHMLGTRKLSPTYLFQESYLKMYYGRIRKERKKRKKKEKTSKLIQEKEGKNQCGALPKCKSISQNGITNWKVNFNFLQMLTIVLQDYCVYFYTHQYFMRLSHFYVLNKPKNQGYFIVHHFLFCSKLILREVEQFILYKLSNFYFFS